MEGDLVNTSKLILNSRIAGTAVAGLALALTSLSVRAEAPTWSRVGISVASTPASTASSTERTATVQFSDLNLADPHGMATLQARIRTAVNLVCGELAVRQLKQAASVGDCRDAAFANAEAQVMTISKPTRLAVKQE